MELEKSILLQKQVKDNSEDLQSEFLDLKNWEEQMKRKERELLSERSGQEVLPPIRRKTKKRPKKETKETKEMGKNSERIKSNDYASWDKFDVNKACKDLENEEQSNSSSEEAMSREELEKEHEKANKHKQQGNVFVKQKEWDKAIASYSEAIKIFPYDAIFYANRALCHLKRDNLYSAEADCSSAIQLDDSYVKAYHRRATARMELKQYKEAKQDIEKILVLEPSNKEAQTLLGQINKRLESSKPIIISEKDLAEDISVEKKIGEKMLGNIKSNRKVIDAKEEVKKKQSNVDSTVKPTTKVNVRKPLNSCIPEWLPEKDDVAIVQPVTIPPHLRSKEPLRKIPIQEADLTKPIKKEKKVSCNKKHVKLSDISPINITKHTESVRKNEEEENLSNSCIEVPSVPKTAVQFLIDWKKYTSPACRYKYLKQIAPESLPNLFQNSMESFIFDDILAILRTEFMKREEPIFSYLKGLSNISRFRTFVMFISNAEKQNLKLMFSYCKTSEKISEEEVAELQNKYEI
ncbi:hypothetical protein DMN91_003368 [Ooceraea biroi]|uniref:RNA polymerase II-associated protein 3 n=1 Tax=Ooceraea biroi TaxID=2015173 RepID=A0A026WRY4_OOCBI|nr:RNA polymerase II-associated protein 3 [Ooceraea biroi]EZA57864.1 RNA polymerase II-associated protein [Ooceraea biroi]RLU25275.1 hypothetical protein DMN91_003368 [Ooceraea biroi]